MVKVHHRYYVHLQKLSGWMYVFIRSSLSLTLATLLNISIRSPYNLQGKIEVKHSKPIVRLKKKTLNSSQTIQKGPPIPQGLISSLSLSNNG